MIIYRIQQHLHGKSVEANESSAQTALNVALFPVLYFFSGLFYTDVWSTIFVLAGYLATLRGKTWAAGVFGWTSLWFRQTNVVWVGFMAGVFVVEKLRELQVEENVEKKELKTELMVDPRRWSEVEFHNPVLTAETTTSGRSPYRLVSPH